MPEPTPTTRIKRSDASNHRAEDEGTWNVGAHDTLLWRVDTAAELRILFVPGSAAAHLATMNAVALENRKSRRRRANLFGALAGILVPALLAVLLSPLRLPLLSMLIALALFSIFVFVCVRTVAMAEIDDGSRFGRGEAGDQNRLRHRAGVVALVVPAGIGRGAGRVADRSLTRRVLDEVTPQLRDDLIAMSNSGHHRGVREVLDALADDERDRRRREHEARQSYAQRDASGLVERVLERARSVDRRRQKKGRR